MKTYKKLDEISINYIKPQGWLRKYLENQRDGLTGHLEAAGYPFNMGGWSNQNVDALHGEKWWPYEQTGYWIDGMIRCGYLLDDEFLIKKAMKHIDSVLENADPDGYLGPKFLKKPGNNNRWPHVVFFRALMAHYSATQDPRIPEALRRHYLSGTSPHCEDREVCNVEIILWAYEQTGDVRLLEHAREAYEKYNKRHTEKDTTVEAMLSDKVAYEHGVTYNEVCKLGAILYMYTGEKRLLDATVNAYRKIDRDHMLIDGVCSSSEFLGGKDSLDSHETCDIADYTWSCGYLLLATGNAEYADKIEKACFNAAPGAVTSDFKALQYFSCPNQVVADKSSNHNHFNRGLKWMSYRPNPGTECCPGEVNRIMPNYVSRMWLSDGADGIAAALYGPSRVKLKLGKEKKEVTIIEETSYPFSENIRFIIRTEGPVEFPLYLRIPQWCRRARILINGEEYDVPLVPGTFCEVKRVFSDNDQVTLILPMDITISRWPGGGIGVERGPLVYALRIEENWVVDEKEERCTKEFPAWNLYPASPWNYALEVDESEPEKSFKVIAGKMSDEPWSIANAPVQLKVKARRVKGWEIERKSVISSVCPVDGEFKDTELKGDFQFTPPLPDPATLHERLSDQVEEVTLVPYGCTKLRISIFPKC